MAKMRVYELAKELKLDSKELVRQLIEMGYDVRNHMSTLTEDEAQAVRDKLLESRSEVVQEKRISKRVIRRRRKKIEAPPEAEAAEEEEAAAEAGPAPEAEPAAAAEPEVEAPAQPEEVAAAEPAPEGGEPQPEEAEALAQPAEPEQEPELPAAVEEAAPEPEPEPVTAEAAEAAEAPAEAPEPEKEVKPKKQAKAKAAAKPRRSKSDKPAKIISRPEELPPSRARKAGAPAPPEKGPKRGPASPPVDQATIPPVDRGGDQRTRTRRKKGKKSTSIPDDDFLMRKSSSRRREILDKADLYEGRPMRGRRRGAAPTKKSKKTEITTPKAIKRRVRVGEAITVGELAKRMGIKSAEMVGRLFQMGMMVTVNQSLDVDDATLVANEFGFEVEKTAFKEDLILEQVQDKPEELAPRPPVVTIMGHVDHGKTSLLDAIRATDVVAGEAGGITQHIGAYNVHLKQGGQVVFVDTPGHEAFTHMRARGAQVTDVVVLVVAADDGVMEQTKEAVNHARAAEVPILVAINKTDKAGADPEKVRRQLSEMELVPEEWGGDTLVIDVSAKTGQGVDNLLEMLQLQAEILELKANPNKPARGAVLEARLDKGRGPVATILVQEGTLHTGDYVICGTKAGKIRAMFDNLGRRVDMVSPSEPVEIQGLSGVPEAGDDFAVVESDKQAKQVAEHRTLKKRDAELSAQTRLSLEGFLDQMKDGQVQELKLVVKADVQGSVEALVDALSKLGNEEVKVNVIQAATGAITETDVMLASASDAFIIGFNVRPTGKVSEVAEGEGVEVRTYEVIYQVIDEVKAALTGLLAPTYEEEVIGRVEVRETFRVPKLGAIAGSYVTDGKVERNAQARLLRDGAIVATTRVISLRRFKDDVKEVAQGFECGIGLENYDDIKVGDNIEIFKTHEVAGQL
ncbi:MAG: translation initiation factor IF-2 [Desulfarculaceae bacterium]|jgi:translation initiation factor IF-2